MRIAIGEEHAGGGDVPDRAGGDALHHFGFCLELAGGVAGDEFKVAVSQRQHDAHWRARDRRFFT